MDEEDVGVTDSVSVGVKDEGGITEEGGGMPHGRGMRGCDVDEGQ